MFVLAVIPFVALVCTGHLAMNACVLRSSAGSWCVQWSSVQRCDCAVSPCRSEPYKGRWSKAWKLGRLRWLESLSCPQHCWPANTSADPGHQAVRKDEGESRINQANWIGCWVKDEEEEREEEEEEVQSFGASSKLAEKVTIKISGIQLNREFR
ncbi:unnamed protein product, partial [Symbiodinium sp. KB8]